MDETFKNYTAPSSCAMKGGLLAA